MTAKKNLPASVHARLLNHAHRADRPFQEVLQYYAMERFLYRLSRSPHAERFVLKGALMMRVWDAPYARPTKDIDLLGEVPDELENTFKEVCAVIVEDDGMVFDRETLRAQRIKEDADYPGVRLRFLGTLGNAKAHMQVDVAFGDIVVPRTAIVRYPTLLDFPEPRLSGYSAESVVAEKFEAMVSLGSINTRMKDFYDIWLLSRERDFEGRVLREAIVKTFQKRSTAVVSDPVSLGSSFVTSESTQRLWTAFRRGGGASSAPESFEGVAAYD
jgi:predicted nucleotidyltransferase component of viral defense system